MSAPSARIVIVKAQPIELCQLLKFSGLAETGGAAKHLIGEGGFCSTASSKPGNAKRSWAATP